MPDLKAVRYLVLVFAASVLVMAALTACGGGSNGGGNNGGISGSSSGSSSSVTGTVTWPDGHPAANASVYFYDHEPQFSATADGWSDGKYGVEQLPSNGSYSLGGCPCGDLTAYLYVPSTPGADPANGGRDCWIIMQDTSGNYSGLQASPGDVINWQARDMLCSPTWYASDQSAVQSQATAIDPSQNGGDPSAYAGTWQAAEGRTSGGGSGG